jgi:hypothetical protein
MRAMGVQGGRDREGARLAEGNKGERKKLGDHGGPGSDKDPMRISATPDVAN